MSDMQDKWSLIILKSDHFDAPAAGLYCGEYERPNTSDADQAYRAMIGAAMQSVGAKFTGGIAYWVSEKARLIEFSII